MTMAVTTDKPYGCLNCKTRVSAEQEKCPKCGDRLKAAPRRPFDRGRQPAPDYPYATAA